VLFFKIKFYRDLRLVLHVIEKLMKCSFQINIVLNEDFEPVLIDIELFWKIMLYE